MCAAIKASQLKSKRKWKNSLYCHMIIYTTRNTHHVSNSINNPTNRNLFSSEGKPSRTANVARHVFTSSSILLRSNPSVSVHCGKLGRTNDDAINFSGRQSYNGDFLNKLPTEGICRSSREVVTFEEYK